MAMIERPFLSVGPPCRDEARAAQPVGVNDSDDGAILDQPDRYFAQFAIIHPVIDNGKNRAIEGLYGLLETQPVLGDIGRVLASSHSNMR
jgi:hypothetical protein